MGIDTAKILLMMNQKGITCYSVALKTEIDQSTISRVLNGNHKNPSINTIASIARVLGVKIEEILLA